MIFDAETNVLLSYLCSLQVYIQEFDMCMRRLYGGPEHAKAQTKEACLFFKKELLSYLLCSFFLLKTT